MTAQILDGKALSQKIKDSLKAKVATMPEKPGLAVVLVGDDPASQVYVNSKEKACQEIGYYSQKIVLPEYVNEADLLAVVDQLNQDNRIHGILVQFPLPLAAKASEETVVMSISPKKDVDGLHPINVGLLNSVKELPDDLLVSCTPKGVMKLLSEYNIPTKGKKAVVIGRSNLVGRPVASLLLLADSTVTICHSRTTDIPAICREADILVVAIGKPEFVDETYVKDGAVVIDVGINRTAKGLVGDVKYDVVKEKASFITPVPGGVGPMTIAMLMENVMQAYYNQNEKVKFL